LTGAGASRSANISAFRLFQALTVADLASSDETMIQSRSIALVLVMAATSPAVAETASFESSAEILGESCGKDIDANCFGVNFDAPRLKECLSRNQDSVSAQCRADYVKAFDAIQKRLTARANIRKMCEYDRKRFCADPQYDFAGVITCLLKMPRGMTLSCKQAVSDTGYR
jgi:hypothetical protein